MNPYIKSLHLKGFKPFRNTSFDFGRLEVIVGANGSGKTSLFEFLRFLRDAVDSKMPPEIIKGSIGQEIFHLSGEDFLRWILAFKGISVDFPEIIYKGSLIGPKHKCIVGDETLFIKKDNYVFFDKHDDNLQGIKRDLYLGHITYGEDKQITNSRNFILNWRFFSAFNIDSQNIRKSVLVEQEPILHEDAGNLSSVLHFLKTEHPDTFEEMQIHLRSVIPGFKGITVKARGGPGEVIAFWKEDGIDKELTIADLSDGIIRLICWITLCVQPNPPSLICIDEPDLGVHPRTLPVLAGLFEKASERTQILLATHSSYFLTLFDLDRIAVMKKENGEAKFIKPKDSLVLKDLLADFGPEEIEAMHITDELENLA